MRVSYSKEFVKSISRLSGKLRNSVVSVINEVIDANSISDITDCKKIETLKSVYRIRIGDHRAFFVLHFEIEGDLVKFEYFVSRGEAYTKKYMDKLRNRDV